MGLDTLHFPALRACKTEGYGKLLLWFYILELQSCGPLPAPFLESGVRSGDLTEQQELSCVSRNLQTLHINPQAIRILSNLDIKKWNLPEA